MFPGVCSSSNPVHLVKRRARSHVSVSPERSLPPAGLHIQSQQCQWRKVICSGNTRSEWNRETLSGSLDELIFKSDHRNGADQVEMRNIRAPCRHAYVPDARRTPRPCDSRHPNGLAYLRWSVYYYRFGGFSLT